MSNDLTPFRYPWEPVPVGETVAAIQRDLAYIVTHTAVLVHSSRPALEMLVNTLRGQIVPRGQVKFKDGTTLELQDIGMPQVNCEEITVGELMKRIWDVAKDLGLEMEK